LERRLNGTRGAEIPRISAADQAKLFQEFQQADNAKAPLA
jgi:hypothetical protein